MEICILIIFTQRKVNGLMAFIYFGQIWISNSQENQQLKSNVTTCIVNNILNCQCVLAFLRELVCFLLWGFIFVLFFVCCYFLNIMHHSLFFYSQAITFIKNLKLQYRTGSQNMKSSCHKILRFSTWYRAQ